MSANNIGRLPLVWFESEWEVGVYSSCSRGRQSAPFSLCEDQCRLTSAATIGWGSSRAVQSRRGFGGRFSLSAFTLIELLVVIGVIAILAGFLLPTLVGVKTRAKSKIAKSEVTGLAAAIAQYESEYSRVPVPKAAIDQLLLPGVAFKDFTYGGRLQDNTLVESYATIGYKVTNDQLVAILQSEGLAVSLTHSNLSARNNPRKITFFEAKRVSSVDIGGIGTDGVLRDPWGTPYFVTVDVDGDEKVADGFYGKIRKNVEGMSDNNVPFRAPVAIWSAGPDLKANIAEPPKGTSNKDNIVSWE